MLAFVGRLGRRQVIYAAALFGMFLLQSVFVAMRADLPMVAALHPVNGFLILIVSGLIARLSWQVRSEPAAVAAAAPADAPAIVASPGA